MVTGLDNRDNIVSSLTRFILELVAWIAGPWAVFAVYGWPGAAIALGCRVALPAVFSTRGDKKHVIIPTPGPIRLLVEFFLFAVAGYAALQVWPIEAVWAVWGAIGVGVLAGMPRSIWLLRGAPEREGNGVAVLADAPRSTRLMHGASERSENDPESYLIEGEIHLLKCTDGEDTLPILVVVSDTDQGLDGVVSLTSPNRQAVVLAIAEPDEWHDLANEGGDALEQRVSTLMGEEFIYPRLSRVEDTSSAQGLSFQKYLRNRPPPLVHYRCSSCPSGEAVAETVVTVEEFRAAGGDVLLSDRRLELA